MLSRASQACCARRKAHVITSLLMVNFLIAVMNKNQEKVQNEADSL